MISLALFVPGPPEFLVLLLVALMVFGVPLVLVGALVVLYRNRRQATEERIAELERQVDELAEHREKADDVTPPAEESSGDSSTAIDPHSTDE